MRLYATYLTLIQDGWPKESRSNSRKSMSLDRVSTTQTNDEAELSQESPHNPDLPLDLEAALSRLLGAVGQPSNATTGTTHFQKSQAREIRPELESKVMQEDGDRTLIEIAKSEPCSAEAFLARARQDPRELSRVEDDVVEDDHMPKSEEGDKTHRRSSISSRMTSLTNVALQIKTKKGGFFEPGIGQTPVHFFLKNCHNLNPSHLIELKRLNNGCFSTTSSTVEAT